MQLNYTEIGGLVPTLRGDEKTGKCLIKRNSASFRFLSSPDIDTAVRDGLRVCSTKTALFQGFTVSLVHYVPKE